MNFNFSNFFTVLAAFSFVAILGIIQHLLSRKLSNIGVTTNHQSSTKETKWWEYIIFIPWPLLILIFFLGEVFPTNPVNLFIEQTEPMLLNIVGSILVIPAFIYLLRWNALQHKKEDEERKTVNISSLQGINSSGWFIWFLKGVLSLRGNEAPLRQEFSNIKLYDQSTIAFFAGFFGKGLLIILAVIFIVPRLLNLAG